MLTRSLKWVGVLLVACVALTTLCLVLLFRTDLGRSSLIALAESLAERQGLILSIGALEGALPFEIRLEDVSLADTKGEVASLGRAEVDLDAMALLKGGLTIQSVAIRDVKISRSPELPETPASGPAAETDQLPGFPIAVRALTVAPLTLGPAIAGEKVILDVRSEVKVDPDAGVDAGFKIERKNGDGIIKGRFSSDAVFSRLKISVTGEAAQGGWISRLMALPGEPAITVALDGEGPLEGFTSRYEITAGPELNTRGTVQISSIQPLDLTIDGAATIASLLPAEIREMVSAELTYGLRAAIDEQATRIDVTELRLDHVDASVSGEAELRLDVGSVDASVEGKVIRPALITGFVPGLIVGGGGFKVSATGPVVHPSVTADLWMDEIAFDRNHAERLEARVSAGSSPIQGTASLALTGLEIADFPSARLGDALAAESRFSLSGDLLDLSGVSVQLGRASVDGDATLNVATGSAGFSFDVIHGALHDIVGALKGGRLDGVAYGQLDGGLLALQIGGRLDGIRFENPNLAPLTSGSAEIWVSTDQKSATQWDVSSIEIDTGHAKLGAAGELDAATKSGSADLTLTINDIGLLDASGSVESGAVTLTATLAGNAEAAKIQWELLAADLSARRIDVPEFTGKGSVQSKGTSLRGNVDFHARTPLGPARAAANIAWDGRALSLKNLRIDRAEDAVMGELVIVPSPLAVDGMLDVHVAKLLPWTALADVPLDGNLRASVALSHDGKHQGVAWDTALNSARLTGANPVSIERVESKGNAKDVLGSLGLETLTTVSEVSQGAMRIGTLDVNIEGDLAKLSFDVEGAGSVNDIDIQFGAGGNSSFDKGIVIGLKKFEISGTETLVTLTRPARITNAAGSASLENLDLSLFGGHLAASGGFDGNQLTAALELETVDLRKVTDLIGFDLAGGELNATASLSGAPWTPTGQIDISARDIRGLGGRSEDLPPVALEVGARLDNGTLQGRMSLSGIGNTPVVATLASRVPKPGETIPLAAELAWSGDLGVISQYLPLGGNLIDGDVGMDLRVDGVVDTAEGTFQSGETAGLVTLRNGLFENFLSGAVLDPIDIELELDGTQLTVKRMEAGDSDAGKLRVVGLVDFVNPAQPDVALDMVMEEMTLIRRDDAQVQLDARISVQSQDERFKISGDIINRNAEFRLIGGLPPQVEELVVEEVRSGVTITEDREQETTNSKPIPIDLDIKFSAPGLIFVRGRGLDSEWGGEIQVSGTAGAPSLVGEIAPIRGGFEFASRKFELGDGGVKFLGGDEIEPLLNLSATHGTPEFTAVVNVIGTASKPEIVLSSDPSLPEDEILAKILFGKFTAQLGAAEVVQLAQSTRTLLSGEAGAIDKIRDAIGVDVLTFAPGANDKELGRLKAGKYIRDDVFVGVEQGTSPGSTRSVVEWTLTPKVTLEGSFGSGNESKVGIQRRWEY